jgi:beta-phosphoglucomutase-like phosphatase (HAD superfamily)
MLAVTKPTSTRSHLPCSQWDKTWKQMHCSNGGGQTLSLKRRTSPPTATEASKRPAGERRDRTRAPRAAVRQAHPLDALKHPDDLLDSQLAVLHELRQSGVGCATAVGNSKMVSETSTAYGRQRRQNIWSGGWPGPRAAAF